MNDSSYRFAIVGAGISGLYSAYQLLKSGVPCQDIIILERSLNPGGRIRGARSPIGLINLGAGRFNTQTHPLLYNLMREFNLNLIPHVIENPKLPSWLYDSEIVNFESQLPDINKSFVECVKNKLSAEHVNTLKFTGYQALLNNNLPASEAIRIILEHPEFSSPESSRWVEPKDGFSSLVAKLYKKIESIKVIMGATVEEIQTSRHGLHELIVSQVLPTKNVIKLCAEHVIYAAPDLTCLRLSYPDFVREVEQASEPVPLFKSYFYFDQPFSSELASLDRDPNRIFLSTENSLLSKLYIDFRRQLIWIYNDSDTAKIWFDLVKDQNFVEKAMIEIATTLKIDRSQLPLPCWSASKTWQQGVFFWRSQELRRQVHTKRMTLSKKSKIHFVSCRFASISGWIEGALENVVDLLNNMIEEDGCVYEDVSIQFELPEGVKYVESIHRV